jgi:hypothetical protein
MSMVEGCKSWTISESVQQSSENDGRKDTQGDECTE